MSWTGLWWDEEDRTPDLRIANAALSQLSYIPDTQTLIAVYFSAPGWKKAEGMRLPFRVKIMPRSNLR